MDYVTMDQVRNAVSSEMITVCDIVQNLLEDNGLPFNNTLLDNLGDGIIEVLEKEAQNNECYDNLESIGEG